MIAPILYAIALIMTTVSYIINTDKTKSVLKNAWKSFESIMPQFLSIIFIMGILLAMLKPEEISAIVGSRSGILGVLLSAIVGSITMMPTFVAFHTADMLIKSGAGYAQVGALVSTLTMVGVVTFPLEARLLGKRAAFYRNFLAFLFSFIVAFVIGDVMG